MQCLEMPARTFFTMLREGRRLKRRDWGFLLHEITNIVLSGVYAESQGVSFANSLKDFYNSDVDPVDEKKPSHYFEADDPMVGEILLGLAKQKMQLAGLR